jgi:hypothetical protein
MRKNLPFFFGLYSKIKLTLGNELDKFDYDHIFEKFLYNSMISVGKSLFVSQIIFYIFCEYFIDMINILTTSTIPM